MSTKARFLGSALGARLGLRYIIFLQAGLTLAFLSYIEMTYLGGISGSILIPK